VQRYPLTSHLGVSRVVTGLWQLADMARGGPLDVDALAATMPAYADAGLTTFDMADHYGPAEEVAGLFREQRERGGGPPVELLTKWVPPPGPVTRQDVRTAVHRALSRLRVDALDLLQFHAWSFAHPSWLDCLFWLQELRHEGRIRALGVTNFDSAHLGVAIESGFELVSNQICYSLLDQRPRQAMTALCTRYGVAILAYGTLAGGLLTERWLDADPPNGRALGTWSQMKYARFVEAAGGWSGLQRVLQATGEVARRHHVSMANVATRYILDQSAVAGVIIGARLGERAHIEDNLRVFEFALDARDRDQIASALATLEPIPGDSGDEYRRPPYLTASGDLSHHVDSVPTPYEVRTGANDRAAVSSGTQWEWVAGFSRAVRRGQRVWISGTTATHRDRLIGGTDPSAQMHFVVDKIEGALQSLGGTLADVVRTRVYVRNLSDAEAVARVHGQRFAGIQPANTLVQAGLVGDEYLVEMEAEAELRGSG
jgi:aryl-alcohol dehydrogenase-like predicted oxidoreductase/enamine deaminase RidA (YjgF/YER057c/UK114 family)